MPQLRIEPEFKDAYEAWRAAPGPATAGGVLRAVDPLIGSALRAYAPNGGPSLRGRAKAIALRALPAYDPSRGPLKPHLMSHLQGLRRLAGREGVPIRLPERVALDRMRLEEAHNALADELGRPPSDEELAARSGLGRARIAKIRLARKPVAEGLVDARSFGDEESGGSPAVRTPGRDDGQAEWLEMVYDELSPADQFVMERALGMRGHARIGPGHIARAMGVTPGAVSQRMARIQSLIDRREELGLL